MAILVLAGLIGGCATVQQAPKADFADTGLRPINQDLVAWLDRLNAAPTGALATKPPPSLPPAMPASEPSSNTQQAALVPPAKSMPAATLPSPGVPAPAAASTPTPPAPAVAAAAGAPSSVASPPAPAPEAKTDTALAESEPETAPKPKPKPKPEWLATPGATLRGVVETWAQREHWHVIWNAPVDYPIAGRLRFEGTFLEAIRGIFLAHAAAERPLKAEADTTHSQLTVTE